MAHAARTVGVSSLPTPRSRRRPRATAPSHPAILRMPNAMRSVTGTLCAMLLCNTVSADLIFSAGFTDDGAHGHTCRATALPLLSFFQGKAVVFKEMFSPRWKKQNKKQSGSSWATRLHGAAARFYNRLANAVRAPQPCCSAPRWAGRAQWSTGSQTPRRLSWSR